MSTIDMQCPFCHADLEIPEEFAGKEGECPSCSKTIIVPDQRTTKVTSKKTFKVNRNMMEADTQTPVIQKPSSNGMPITIIIGLLVLMIITICVSVTAIMMVKTQKPSEAKTDTIKSELNDLQDKYKTSLSENSKLRQMVDEIQNTKISSKTVKEEIANVQITTDEQLVIKLVDEFLKCRRRGDGVSKEKVYFTETGYDLNRSSWKIWEDSYCSYKDFLYNIIKWEIIDFSYKGKNEPKTIAQLQVSILHSGNNRIVEKKEIWTFLCEKKSDEWKINSILHF